MTPERLRPGATRGARRSRRRGAALVIALLVMAALLLLGTTFLTISTTETDIARNAQEAVQAFYAAETGLARLKRDLVAQFALPYQNLCPNIGVYADLTRPSFTLTTGEPLDVPSRRTLPGRRDWDQDGSVTCAKPGAAEYYFIWDAQGQPVSPAGPTWRTVPYAQDAAGGPYHIEVWVRNATTPTDPSCPSCIEARVKATSASGASRQLEAKLQVDRFTPNGHALWADGGVWRWGGGGNVVFSGPVFTKGWSASYPAMQLGSAGGADSIASYYKNMDATLQRSIPAPSTMDSTLRVYQGPVEISNGSSSVGEQANRLSGVHTNQGFSGAQAGNVYANTPPQSPFDVPRELTGLPDLAGPYSGAPLPPPPPGVQTPSPAWPRSHDEYLQNPSWTQPALTIEGGITIDGTTQSFSYDSQGFSSPPRVSDVANCAGGCLIYEAPTSAQGGAAAPPTLRVKGVIWVKGDIVLGGYGANRLPAIRYEAPYDPSNPDPSRRGGGTLYARYAPSDGWGGSIEVTSDLLPPAGLPIPSDGLPQAAPPPPQTQFATGHNLGLISSNWMEVGDWSTSGSAPPPLRIAATIYSNYGMYNTVPYQVAGSVASRYFYVWQSASIYYVPALRDNPAPGMPGVSGSKATSPYFVRTLFWRDVMP